jgi:hypothetical protein
MAAKIRASLHGGVDVMENVRGLVTRSCLEQNERTQFWGYDF